MELSKDLQNKINQNIELNDEELKQLNLFIEEREKKEKEETSNPPKIEKDWEQKIIDGDIETPPELKVIDGKIVRKSMKELYDEKIIDKEKYIDYQRNYRDSFLFNTDKYLLLDFPIQKTELEQIKLYRQYLRDLPQNKDFPDIEIMTLEDYKGAENGK